MVPSLIVHTIMLRSISCHEGNIGHALPSSGPAFSRWYFDELGE